MTKDFSCVVANQYYDDIKLSLSYDKRKGEWNVDVLEPKGLPDDIVRGIRMEALYSHFFDFNELQMEWEYDQEERDACDRYHRDRDEW
jgi:hypothetical protein